MPELCAMVKKTKKKKENVSHFTSQQIWSYLLQCDPAITDANDLTI